MYEAGFPRRRDSITFFRGLLISAVGIVGVCVCGPASAQSQLRDDPYAFDLRIGVFPVTFQAGLSQTSLGSAVRGEIDVSRRFTLSLAGRLPWLPLAGETDAQGFVLRAGVAWNFVDGVESERLVGTVYPDDTPAIEERGGVEFELPVQQKLGGPPLMMTDVDRQARGAMRTVHSLRVGYDFAQAVERGKPDTSAGVTRYLLNTLHMFYAGYGWATHWNLSAEAAGKRELGWRRFFIDALLTVDALDSARPVGATARTPTTGSDFFPLGVRLGMEGAIAALLRKLPGVGFGYSLEFGVLPGTSGVEGYLFAALGLELDFMLQPRAR
jgi:hypothetical protein